VRRVLAAIDLTAQGRRVAERGRLVAETTGAELVLLHAIEPAPEALISEPVFHMMRSYQEKAAKETEAWCSKRTQQPVQLATPKGSPAWEIVRASKQADLTVVGSSSVDMGRTGPISRRVAEAGRGDVLVVRRQPRATYSRVIAAVDLSEHSRYAVDLAFKLAPEADVTLLFALPTRFDTVMAEAGMFPEEVDLNRKGRLQTARKALQDFGASYDVSTTVADGPPQEVIDEMVRRRTADLVVVASRGAGATRMVLLGSVASALLDAVPCDVAIARVAGDFRRP